ncbi:hypothetical protein AbraCBS73388_006258 [Aspergillus brasiliensis]|uniref:Uncharacterized protein n=2 Tax=Aspergillus brasiliensis TaxID=319629 RepID=A0A1L9UGB9_ASPBC|nr:hypothetical protein ASPBRDRAFT_197413 [Aspergillus brasiliensis CBS 101740]GKZ20655.1 hypothetical protein AbraCBS73388_006258 [Aspergillus brasiliensis]
MSQGDGGLREPAVIDSWVADLATEISLTVSKAGQSGRISNNFDDSDQSRRLAAAVRAFSTNLYQEVSQANLTEP